MTILPATVGVVGPPARGHRPAASTRRSVPARDTAGMSDVSHSVSHSAELLEYTCPRCQLPATEPYYGPCTSCRTTLRATQGGEAREVEVTDYEPKMNVTPNAVATKD